MFGRNCPGFVWPEIFQRWELFVGKCPWKISGKTGWDECPNSDASL